MEVFFPRILSCVQRHQTPFLWSSHKEHLLCGFAFLQLVSSKADSPCTNHRNMRVIENIFTCVVSLKGVSGFEGVLTLHHLTGSGLGCWLRWVWLCSWDGEHSVKAIIASAQVEFFFCLSACQHQGTMMKITSSTVAPLQNHVDLFLQVRPVPLPASSFTTVPIPPPKPALTSLLIHRTISTTHGWSVSVFFFAGLVCVSIVVWICSVCDCNCLSVSLCP